MKLGSVDFGMLRHRLVDAEILVRDASDAVAAEKVRAEQRAVDAAGERGLGKNEEERKRTLALALQRDADYQEAMRILRQAEAARDRQAAQLEAARDQRRAQEWAIRQRLADALLQLPVDGEPDDTAVTEAVLDETLTRFRGTPRRSAPPAAPAPAPLRRNQPVSVDAGSVADLYEPKVGHLPATRRNRPVPVDDEIPF